MVKRIFICLLCVLLVSAIICSCARENEKMPPIDLGGNDGEQSFAAGDIYQPPIQGDTQTDIDVGVGTDTFDTDINVVEPPYKDVEYDINVTGSYEIRSESVYKIDVFKDSARDTHYGRVVALVRDNGVPAVYLDVLDKEQKAILCSKVFNGMCKVFMDSRLESLFVYSATVNSDGRCVLNAGIYMVSDIDQTGKPLGNNGEIGFVSTQKGSSQTVQLTQPEGISKNLLRSMVSTIENKTIDMYCTIADTVSAPVTYDVGSHEKVESAEQYLTWEILKNYYEQRFVSE